ncbi:MAG TPA: hypothetical protein VLF43_00205 [Candidatus Saccharimonadales bacterium]|nr:hypothetical protein [Candidatus Saccharimonadales bacterium]
MLAHEALTPIAEITRDYQLTGIRNAMFAFRQRREDAGFVVPAWIADATERAQATAVGSSNTGQTLVHDAINMEAYRRIVACHGAQLLMADDESHGVELPPQEYGQSTPPDWDVLIRCKLTRRTAGFLKWMGKEYGASADEVLYNGMGLLRAVVERPDYRLTIVASRTRRFSRTPRQYAGQVFDYPWSEIYGDVFSS